MKASALFVAALLAGAVVQAPAQTPTPSATPVEASPPEVGALAPDFSIPGTTRYGLLDQPLRLSDLRGKTVVVAFFPAARTRGCTVQMRAFRDQYGEMFNNGRNVAVVAISADPTDMLQKWANEEDFPVIFGSDPSRRVAALYGAYGTGNRTNRNLFVVDPQGRIAYRALPFREVDPSAYQELSAAIGKLVPSRF